MYEFCYHSSVFLIRPTPTHDNSLQVNLKIFIFEFADPILEEIDPSKSPGSDKIPGRLLKQMGPEISPCLVLVLSASLHQGLLPRDWKQAFVTPLFKKGSRKEPSNYRPISLTCICSKTLEHIIHKNVISHLENQGILSETQYGFRKHHSTELQLIKTCHDLALNLNDRGQTHAILLDFTKAFDKVSHRHLLLKLHYYGVRGSTLQWISSFLTDRIQRVVCGGCVSDPVEILSGVPQGTVLGPLLFLVYINDITQCVSSSCRLFADDCIVYRKINSPTDIKILQDDLLQLEKWADLWHMKFNIDKCMVMLITLKKNPLPFEYHLHNRKLSTVTEAKYLGVLLDSELSFNHHVYATCKKANSVLSFLRRNLRRCHRKVKIDAYNSFVKPILNYAAAVWTPHAKSHMAKLEAVQRRAARFVFSDYRNTSSVSGMLANLNWKTVQIQHQQIQLTIFFKIFHRLVELRLPDYIIQAPRDTRGNAYKFTQPATYIDSYKYSFFPVVIKLWNNLPQDIVNCSDLDTFKSSLNQYL